MTWLGVRATTAAFFAAVAILVVTGSVNYSSMVQVLQAEQWVEHADEVLRVRAALFAALLDAEDGRRGFIDSGDDGELVRYRAAATAVNEKTQTLLTLTADNPQQQQRVRALEPILNEELSGLAESVERSKGDETDHRRQAELTIAGRQLKEKIRALLGDIQNDETNLLRSRRIAAATSLWRTRMIRIVGATVSFAILAVVFWLLRREIVIRERAQEQISRLNGELAQRATELDAANKELEAFSYSVSHDLRAPLRHMHGFVTLLRKRAGDTLDATCGRYVGTINDAAIKMGRLIDDLLTLSRTGRAELRRQHVALSDLVAQAQQEMAPATEGRCITWQIGPLPAVQGDPDLLRLVLINLLSNAIKYTAPRPAARIEIGAIPRENDEVSIFCRDNGVGFDAQYVHKLFGVFQRLHREEEFAGTGIGLATVRRIIQRHGGRVWAESELDHGATFWFSLRAV